MYSILKSSLIIKYFYLNYHNTKYLIIVPITIVKIRVSIKELPKSGLTILNKINTIGVVKKFPIK